MVESLSLEDTSGIYKLSLLKLEMRGNTKSALVYLVGNFRIHAIYFPILENQCKLCPVLGLKLLYVGNPYLKCFQLYFDLSCKFSMSRSMLRDYA